MEYHEVRRKLLEADARRYSNYKLWQATEDEYRAELLKIRSLCDHESVDTFTAQYTSDTICKACGAYLSNCSKVAE
jgi:hypothetical protein